MNISDIKINGITNPIGFKFDKLNLSYLLLGKNDNAFPIILRIFDNEQCVYTDELDYSINFCTPVDFKPKKQTRYKVVISCGEVKGEGFFETGTDFDCKFITTEKEIANPVLFKRFSSEKAVESARLYVTGLGLYEAFLNGQKVGNEYLTPDCNDYNAYLQYQTYDITDRIESSNLFEIALGNGWYKGRFGLNHRQNIYGKEYVSAAKLLIKYTDGTSKEIVTDESWLARPSYVTDGNIYDGEQLDYTRNISEAGRVKYFDKKFNVTERISLPIVVKHVIKPKLYISPKGEKILDFGQNFSGFVSFDCDLKYGQKVRLAAGEVLQSGCFYRDNLRSAKAEFTYVSDGKRRIVRPQFTFFGFRYMLVEGIDNVNPDEFTGNVIYSDLDNTVDIAVYNSKMDRLLKNCLWGQRSNFIDVPTDCPQRDERLGWTGDAEVFSRTACYQMDCKAFYNKYLTDLRIEQKLLGGGIPGYAPSFNEEKETSRSVWADAATIIPWNVYEFFGDKSMLEDHFPLMSDYVDYIIAQDDERGGKRLYNFGFHLGDWLSQDGVSPDALKGATNEYFIASVYYYNSVKIVADSACVLGFKDKEQHYRRVAEEIKRAIISEYFTSSGRLAIDTQTAYVICIQFDLYVDKQKLVRSFEKRLKKDNYKIKGGFVGATQLVQAMIKCGLTDDAFRVLFNEQFPGWLYCVNLGATTIWERWNSLNADGSISGTEMNSLNHYSYGAVAEAFYGYIAGLKSIGAAFKKVIIDPKFNYRLKKLDFTYRSVSGTYVINYEIKQGNKAFMHIEIPYGAAAEFLFEGESRRLKVGVNEFELQLKSNMDTPFSVDSKLCDLLSYRKSSEVIKQIVPTLYRYLTNNDIGLNGETFRSLCSIGSFSIPATAFNAIDKNLREVKYI